MTVKIVGEFWGEVFPGPQPHLPYKSGLKENPNPTYVSVQANLYISCPVLKYGRSAAFWPTSLLNPFWNYFLIPPG